jgi:hypothetical protein
MRARQSGFGNGQSDRASPFPTADAHPLAAEIANGLTAAAASAVAAGHFALHPAPLYPKRARAGIRPLASAAWAAAWG